MNNATLGQITEEIERLHRFFCDWLGGKLPKDALKEDFLASLSPDLVFIPPTGNPVAYDDLASAIGGAYGANPDFRIEIRKVTVRRQFDDYVLATYEEWQRNAKDSVPPDNGRTTTVLFKTSPSLQWLHIHETMLSDDIIAAEHFNF